jgi:hypothetical protein
MNAMPFLSGSALTNFLQALRPSADAPIPTIGKVTGAYLRPDCGRERRFASAQTSCLLGIFALPQKLKAPRTALIMTGLFFHVDMASVANDLFGAGSLAKSRQLARVGYKSVFISTV